MATLAQIASQLNLNKSTVSRALNNRPSSIPEETRREILRVARDLGYAPNPAARALNAARPLNAARTGSIGLVSRRFNNALYTALLQELAIAADARGGNLVSCVTGRTEAHHGQEHLLHTGMVDGILAIPYALPGLDEPNSPWMRRPIVFLLSVWNESKAPSVRFDDENGAAQVARHLWDLGHRRVLLLQGCGPQNHISHIGAERHAFLRAAWSALGGDAERDFTEYAGQATAEGGCAAMREALAARDTATAIVAYNDQMALGAQRTLWEHGLRVPRDLSLVGWNDLDELGQFLTPALTTVRTDPRAFAEAAVDLLHRQINSPPPSDSLLVPPCIRIPVQLVSRETTAPR